MSIRSALPALGLVLLLVLGLAPVLRAERPNLGPDMLEAESTHVLVGQVKNVYTRVVRTVWEGQVTEKTHYLVELEVETVERGEGFAPKDLAYIRCWQRTKSPPRPPPGPGGHGPVPAAGDRVRAYVAKGEYGPTRQEDNGITAVYPNGFVVLTPAGSGTRR